MFQTALVTGATGGIGQAIVDALVNDDIKVIAHYNKNAEAAKLLEKKYGDYVTCLSGDLSTVNGARDFARTITSIYPNIDILVNNAGIAEQKLFTDLTEENIEVMINTNLTSALILTKEISKNMIRNNYGKIVNISSVWGVCGGSCEVHYSASKGGIIAFTKALSKELGLSNVNVNCVAPGFIDTKMNDHLSEEEKQAFIDKVSLNREGKPSDIANAVAFLVSDKARYITGQIIGVDGGL